MSCGGGMTRIEIAVRLMAGRGHAGAEAVHWAMDDAERFLAEEARRVVAESEESRERARMWRAANSAKAEP